uniref:Uncharacterized protein n=1 Tax=Setaria viridis TaxID=4556 RepID=A0A4U6UC48_SETVI|nr:LOW QUALITY PROTEIN: hypothetical protein SEVIR_5G053700v2 [Setaria viridis]
MDGQDGGGDLHVRVVSRSFVRASSASIVPHVLAVSNLDLPPGAGFAAAVAAFEAEAIRCGNQGAEFVVGEASVALASLALDHGASLRRIQLPYGEELALSVQVVSFACGGFTVAWRTNHVMVDGSALSRLVSSWSELARSGTLPAGARPSHDRRELTPEPRRAHAAGRPINALTTEQSFVRRLYLIEASDMERLRHAASCPGTGHRMGWWVNRRQRIAAPALRAAVRNYAGNFTTFTTAREVIVEEVLGLPLRDVAAMVCEAITAPDYDEHLQELVDWVEEHKT